MYYMNTKGVEYSAAVTRKKSSRSARPEAASFAKSPSNPVNQSRTKANKVSGHAPSSRVLDYARSSAQALAKLALSTSATWKLLEQAEHGTEVYELTSEPRSDDYYLVRAVATVDGTVDDVLGMMEAPTTEDLADAGRIMFGKYFNAGVTLNKLTCSTPTSGPDDAYAVHWLSLRCVSKLGSVDNHRDVTVVSYQDAFDCDGVDATPRRVGRTAVRGRNGGSLVGVHSLVSTTLADVPPLPKSEATDRVHFRDSGFVVEPLGPQSSRVSLLLSLLPGSTSDSRKAAKKARKWLQLLAIAGAASLASTAAKENQIRISQSQRQSSQLALQPVARRHWRESDHCYICLKVFRTFRRCHHCRFCGEAVCGGCSGFVDSVSGLSVDSNDPNSQASNSISSGGSSGQEADSSENKGSAVTRACNACMYELEQKLSVALSRSDRVSASESSSGATSDSISLSAYSVDRDTMNSFALAMPDFDDVLEGDYRATSGSVVTRRPPPPPPSYQFALLRQQHQQQLQNHQQIRMNWSSSDSLGSAMRGLQQLNESLSSTSSSLRSHGAMFNTNGSTTSTANSLATTALTVDAMTLSDVSLSSTLLPQRFASFDLSEDESDDHTIDYDTDRNDMIPLAPPTRPEPQFVVFSGAASEPTEQPASKQSDMIPLHLP